MALCLEKNPRPSILNFTDDGLVPNSTLPVVVYKTVFSIDSMLTDTSIRHVLGVYAQRNGWHAQWVEQDAVYRYTHYHSTAHEALLVLDDVGELQLGGRNGKKVKVSHGDMVIIPAGVAHRRVKGGKSFRVAGLYPQGQTWDLLRQTKADYQTALNNVPRVPLPAADPLFGPEGPLMQYWK